MYISEDASNFAKATQDFVSQLDLSKDIKRKYFLIPLILRLIKYSTNQRLRIDHFLNQMIINYDKFKILF